jgi:hypothetical protein
MIVGDNQIIKPELVDYFLAKGWVVGFQNEGFMVRIFLRSVRKRF